MPRDGNLPHRKSEVELLTEMEWILGSEDKWCRYVLFRGAWPANQHCPWPAKQHCLYGALNLADHGNADWISLLRRFSTPEAVNVDKRLRELAGRPRGLAAFFTPSVDRAVHFNNERSYAEVRDLIARTKQSFMPAYLREQTA